MQHTQTPHVGNSVVLLSNVITCVTPLTSEHRTCWYLMPLPDRGSIKEARSTSSLRHLAAGGDRRKVVQGRRGAVTELPLLI